MKITFDTVAQRLDCPCFGKPRCTFNQQVTISQNGNQQTLDQILLTDDSSGQRLLQVQYFLL